MGQTLRVSAAQAPPVWLDRVATRDHQTDDAPVDPAPHGGADVLDLRVNR